MRLPSASSRDRPPKPVKTDSGFLRRLPRLRSTFGRRRVFDRPLSGHREPVGMERESHDLAEERETDAGERRRQVKKDEAGGSPDGFSAKGDLRNDEDERSGDRSRQPG